MKFKSKAMKALVATLATAQGEAAAFTAESKIEDVTAKTNEIKNIKARISALEAAEEGKEFDDAGDEVKDMTPVNQPVHAQAKGTEKGLHLFDNFADQLKAVRNAAINGTVDNRLAKLNAQNAAQGANESNPDEGGYAVQSDFAGMMMDTAATAGEILSRVDTYEISGASNRAVNI